MPALVIKYLCITKEWVQDLPQKDQWTKNKVCQSNPQYVTRQPTMQQNYVTKFYHNWYKQLQEKIYKSK